MLRSIQFVRVIDSIVRVIVTHFFQEIITHVKELPQSYSSFTPKIVFAILE